MLLFQRLPGGGIEVPRHRAYLADDGGTVTHDLDAELVELHAEMDQLELEKQTTDQARDLGSAITSAFTRSCRSSTSSRTRRRG